SGPSDGPIRVTQNTLSRKDLFFKVCFDFRLSTHGSTFPDSQPHNPHLIIAVHRYITLHDLSDDTYTRPPQYCEVVPWNRIEMHASARPFCPRPRETLRCLRRSEVKRRLFTGWDG